MCVDSPKTKTYRKLTLSKMRPNFQAFLICSENPFLWNNRGISDSKKTTVWSLKPLFGTETPFLEIQENQFLVPLKLVGPTNFSENPVRDARLVTYHWYPWSSMEYVLIRTSSSEKSLNPILGTKAELSEFDSLPAFASLGECPHPTFSYVHLWISESGLELSPTFQL